MKSQRKTRKTTPAALPVLIACLSLAAPTVPAADPAIQITSFSMNGQLTWTNAFSDGLFSIEWSPALNSSWRSNWNTLQGLALSGQTNTVEVPMFYRVKCLTNLFFPLPMGGQLMFKVTNAVGNVWTEQMTVLGYTTPTTAGGKEYALLEGASAGGMELNLMRTTDTSVFRFQPNTLSETLEFQRATVGTTWTEFNYEGQWTRKVTLEAIESVTVPAGTFPSCYRFRKQALNSGDPQPEWIEWICPGVGLVKWVDYWVPSDEHPPIVHELQSWGLR